jgi:hypothetical protein
MADIKQNISQKNLKCAIFKSTILQKLRTFPQVSIVNEATGHLFIQL